MGIGFQDAIKQLQAFIDQVDEPLRTTFENVHQGHVTENLMRFLKAREWDPSKAYKMLVDCLNWRVQNEIDNILSKPIVPADLYRAVRDSQLIGLSGYSREGLPVFAIGVGLSTFDKASVHYYVQSHIQINEYRDRVILPSASKKHGRPITTCIKVLDMTGLKLSALNQIKLLTIISSIDDLNYPEKTNTYYIVNVPYIFSACWKVRNYYVKKKDIIPCDLVSCMLFPFGIAVSVGFLLRPQHDVKHSALAGCEATSTREDKKKSAGVTRMWTG